MSYINIETENVLSYRRVLGLKCSNGELVGIFGMDGCRETCMNFIKCMESRSVLGKKEIAYDEEVILESNVV